MEPAHSEKPTSTAPSPFDNPARSDLIVRTADDVSFFVVKAFLVYASPFFSNHLANNSEDETRDVYQAPEDSRTMTAILRLCYPGTILASYLVSVIVETPLVSALRKYGMGDAEERFKSILLEAEMVEKDPISIYAIARHVEWDDLARLAARETLRIPLMQYRELPHALALATALDYQLLLNYFVDCGDAAYNLLDVDSAFSAKGAISDVFAANTTTDSAGRIVCSTCSQILTFGVEAGGERRWVHGWLPEFLKACRQKIRDCPGKVVLCKEIVDEAIVAAARQCTSRSCSPAEVRRCIEFVDGEVQLAISEVCSWLRLYSTSRTAVARGENYLVI